MIMAVTSLINTLPRLPLSWRSITLSCRFFSPLSAPSLRLISTRSSSLSASLSASLLDLEPEPQFTGDLPELELSDEAQEETKKEKAVPLPRYPVPKLTVKEKKELASYAHSLGKKLKYQQVGKSGVTPAVAASFIQTLEANELLKLKVHGNCPEDFLKAIKLLEESTGSVAVSQIGRSVILYRPSLSKMKKEQEQEALNKANKRKSFRKPLTNFPSKENPSESIKPTSNFPLKENPSERKYGNSGSRKPSGRFPSKENQSERMYGNSRSRKPVGSFKFGAGRGGSRGRGSGSRKP